MRTSAFNAWVFTVSCFVVPSSSSSSELAKSRALKKSEFSSLAFGGQPHCSVSISNPRSTNCTRSMAFSSSSASASFSSSSASAEAPVARAGAAVDAFSTATP